MFDYFIYKDKLKIYNMKIYENFIEKEETYTMYHGTDKIHEDVLLKKGFIPNKCLSGSQCGNPAYLYLTLSPESASWYACMKGNKNTILEIKNIPKSYLGVDPEDGMYIIPYDLDKELEVNGSFILKTKLDSSYFKIYDGELSVTGCDDNY